MLIFFNTSFGSAAVDQGVIRARDAQALTAVEDLYAELAFERENLHATVSQQAEVELTAAREEAAQMLAEAQQQADLMRQQAYEEGMAKAVSEWHDRGVEAAVDKNEALRDTHERLAEIVSNAVERIVHSEDRATLYRRALKNVQTLTRGATTLRLRVGPADYANARECIAGIPDSDSAGLSIEVISDAALRPGSCIFESDVGVLDASIETQLDALRSAMARAVRRASNNEEATGVAVTAVEEGS